MSNLHDKQLNHIVRLLKQKFISPFKIIYMIDQKQADYFKARNQNKGCCTATEVTIPSSEQSKIEKYLSQLITASYIKNNLNELFSFCQDRYKNIVQKGKQDNLKITNEVQKYLIDNILGESVNNFIHKRLVEKLTMETNSISTQLGLWATPATWFSKYPHIRLQLFQSKSLGELFNRGYTVIGEKLYPFLHGLYNNLLLLQKDGRFQEILWKNKLIQQQRGNQQKILRNPQLYSKKASQEEKEFNSLQIACIMMQSIPFQLNMKANCYFTVSDAIQAYYYASSAYQKKKINNNCKYEILISTIDIEISVNGKQKISLRAGSIFIISGVCQFQFQSQNTKDRSSIFLLRSMVNEAKRKE